MGEENEVKLHGMWASTYSKRVELALKVKGIPYEYIEEVLSNKSPLLLEYNPVHKKVPVLVHNGKPICESYIILEYIDEAFENGPKLLPKDPYRRAKARFWASFIQELSESLSRVIATHGEEQEKAAKEMIEKQKVFESGIQEFFTGDGPFTNGANLGLLDILTCAILGIYDVQEQVFGAKFLDPQKTPFLFSWVTKMNEHPLVKETSPPRDQIVQLLQLIKKNMLCFSGQLS